MILLDTGQLWAWGFNSFGELGIGNNNKNQYSAELVPLPAAVIQFSVGAYHVLCICGKDSSSPPSNSKTQKITRFILGDTIAMVS